MDQKALERINGTNTIYNSNVNGGAAERGVLGPFGILVLTGSLSSKLQFTSIFPKTLMETQDILLH